VGFLIYGFITAMIHRSDQFWKRFGSDIPWYAQVGGFLWVFTVSVGDAFGVSGILEGIFRTDLVSGEDLTAEEAAKRATQGVLTLAFLFLMRGAVKKFGGTPTPEPVPPVRPPVDPNLVPDPNRPPVRPPDPVAPEARAYDPSTRTNAELQLDRDPTARPGETPDQAADRVRRATGEIELRRVQGIFEALGDQPRRVRVRAEDAANAGRGAHTIDNHGSNIQLDMPRDATGNHLAPPTGVKSIEGRIFGDTGWPDSEPNSFKWISDAIMDRTVNDYLRDNWDQVRSDIATNGQHSANFNAGGGAVGEGFFDPNQTFPGPRNPVAAFMRTSLVRITIRLIPGPPPDFFILTTFPNALGALPRR
jgi:hypothetical protein